MEEFQHYADNATFDDMGTSEASQFLLRIYLEKLDPKYKPALERAVNFVLDSQLPSGGWPQRWPADPNYPEYQSYITFNDDVAAENVKFLTMVYQHLGDTRALAAISRGMDIYLLDPAAGAPSRAGRCSTRSTSSRPRPAPTSPRRCTPRTTASNVEQLMDFYRMTGDRRFLARIPEALDWLETVRLPDAAPRTQLPDLRRDRHQQADLRPPPRLERRQRRILLGLQPRGDARALQRVPQRSTSPSCGANTRR